MSDAITALVPQDLDFLRRLVHAHYNVPLGRETPFTTGGSAIGPPGLQGGYVKPDWGTVRRLVAAGFLNYDEKIHRSPSWGETRNVKITITDQGFVAASPTVTPRRAAPEEVGPVRNEVFVVYGRNRAARDTVFAILRAVNLRPLDFDQAGELTGSASPYVGDVLTAAFARAQAVVVLFTDDEWAQLRDGLRQGQETVAPELQPRPNVILEAGMALGLHPTRTVLVEMGTVRTFSDLAGRHMVKWGSGDVSVRMALLQKLTAAGCPVDLSSSDWMTVAAELQDRSEGRAHQPPPWAVERSTPIRFGGETAGSPLEISDDALRSLAEGARDRGVTLSQALEDAIAIEGRRRKPRR